jgi:hypothetical protein
MIPYLIYIAHRHALCLSRLEPCVQGLAEILSNALRLEARLARALVICARARSMTLVAAPPSEVAASRQLYKTWTASFALGYQPAHFAAELPIWAAAGVAHAPKSKIAQSSSVTLSAHASFEVMVRYLRDCYAASARLVRLLGDSSEALVLALRLLSPGYVWNHSSTRHLVIIGFF